MKNIPEFFEVENEFMACYDCFVDVIIRRTALKSGKFNHSFNKKLDQHSP